MCATASVVGTHPMSSLRFGSRCWTPAVGAVKLISGECRTQHGLGHLLCLESSHAGAKPCAAGAVLGAPVRSSVFGGCL